MASRKSQSPSFTASCTAEIKEEMDEETDVLNLKQSVKQQKASFRDKQCQYEATIPNQVTETECGACKGTQCNVEDKKDEKLFSVFIKTTYNIRTGKEHSTESEIKCNLHEYMKWKFIMNSPSQCDKCTNHFSSAEENMTLQPKSSVTVLSPVNNKEHAKRITEKVFEYAVCYLGKVLTVETIEIKNKNIKIVAEKLNVRFGQEIAYVSAIEDELYIVFPKSGGETVEKFLLQYNKDVEQKSEEETVCLKIVLKPDVVETVLKAKSDEAKLKHIDIKLSPRKRNGLKYLNIEDIINEHLRQTQFRSCLYKQTDTYHRLYCSEANMLSEAASFVNELIVEWDTDMKERSIEDITALLEHLRSKYVDKVWIDTDGECRVYMVGLKGAVDEALAELVDIQEGRKSVNVAKISPELQRKVTEVYEVRDKKHLNYFEKPVFIEKIENKFKVKVVCVRERYALEITGFEKEARMAIECLHKMGRAVVSDSVVIVQSTAVSFFEGNSGEAFFDKIERESDVYLEKQSIKKFSNDKMYVSKTENKGYNSWIRSDDDKSVFLEQLDVNKVMASVKIIPSTHCSKTGDLIVKGQYMVSMGLPAWTDGNNLECERLEQTLSQIFVDINTTKENSVALSLEPTAKWPFESLMKCIVKFTVKWLLTSPKRKPSSVKLCSREGNFCLTDKYIDKCMETTIQALQHSDELKVAVCKGQLDKMKVDVLVNTAAPNLDLTKGNVSAALLKTAGQNLQEECWKCYPKGIKHNEIAVTCAYNAGCKRVFHMTLLPYNQASTENCISYMQKAMMLCLERASRYSYTSIAFPAIGTGSLGYPVELIATQMFNCVSTFKQEHPNTTLKEVLFVIYPKDTEALQYFEKAEREAKAKISPTSVVSHQTRIEVTGVKEDVDHAKELFKTKNSELLQKDTTITADITNMFSRTSVITKQERDDAMVNLEQTQINIGGNFRSFTDTSKYLQSDKTDIINRDEEIMETEDSSGVVGSTTQRRCERNFSWSKDARNVRLYKCGEYLVRAYEGDILNVQVDCIVNAANKDLQHCGGVAYVIAAAAGETFRRDSEDVVKKKGPLTVTSVERTGPGDLPYKCVIHAVGPCWDDYKPVTKRNLEKCAEDLKKTIYNCLQLADDGQLTSIAFPSVSSGLFGVPKDICAVQYAEALKMFSRGKRMLSDIHFVDSSRTMVDILHKTFKDMITDGKQAPFDMRVYLDRPLGNRDGAEACSSNRKIAMKNTARSRPKYFSTVKNETPKQLNTETYISYTSDGKKLKCFFPSFCVVEIYGGDIMKVSGVDAIVCSENRKGEAKGMIANLLLKEGGQDYCQMKAVQFEGLRNYGEVITVPGERNRFKWIMHAVVSRDDHSVIPVIYRNVFEEAKARNITSLALPIMGTGSGHLDPVSSSEMLFLEWMQFCLRSTTPVTLHLVINDADVASLVKDVFKKRIEDVNKSPLSTEVNKDKETAACLGVKTVKKHGKGHEAVVSTENQSATEDDCVICMDKVTAPKKLRCGHTFCTECIEGYFRVKKVCPTCGKVCGIITGDQPKGTMEIVKRRSCVAGYEHYKSISITYRFEQGKQGPDHPKPGVLYKPISRTAYLPDNTEGREICGLLKVAFERRLVFTIGTSRTTGEEGVITWNDIHHKTDIRPNTQFGYPDNTYLQRVREELEAKGVTKDDIDRNFIKQLDKDHFRKTIS